MIGLFSASLLFHLCVLVGIVPFQMVWGGRLANRNEMFVFEAISICVNLFFLAVTLVKAGLVQVKLTAKVLDRIFLGMAAVFILNTVGNLFSKNEIESWLFTPITALLAALCFWARGEPKRN